MPLFSSLGAGNVQRTNKGKERGWYRARIITHGYVGGGYKDSSPWRNVNRTIHSTDVTTDLGDMLNEDVSTSVLKINHCSKICSGD